MQASELLLAAVFLPALIDDSAGDFRVCVDAMSVVSSPPASDRILPLLI